MFGALPGGASLRAQTEFSGRPAVVAGIPQKLKLDGILAPILKSQAPVISAKLRESMTNLTGVTSEIPIHFTQKLKLSVEQRHALLQELRARANAQTPEFAPLFQTLDAALADFEIEVEVRASVRVEPKFARVAVFPAGVYLTDQFLVSDLLNTHSRHNSDSAQKFREELIAQLKDPLRLKGPVPSLESADDAHGRVLLRRAIIEGAVDPQWDLESLKVRLRSSASNQVFEHAVDVSKVPMMSITEPVRVTAHFSVEEDWSRRRPSLVFPQIQALHGNGRMLSNEERYAIGNSLLTSLSEEERQALRHRPRGLFLLDYGDHRGVEAVWETVESRERIRDLLRNPPEGMQLSYAEALADAEMPPYRLTTNEIRTNFEELQIQSGGPIAVVNDLLGQEASKLALEALHETGHLEALLESTKGFTPQLAERLAKESPRVLLFSELASPDRIQVLIDNEANRARLTSMLEQKQIVFSAEATIPLRLVDFEPRFDPAQQKMRARLTLERDLKVPLKEVRWFPARGKLPAPLDQLLSRDFEFQKLNAELALQLGAPTIELELPYAWSEIERAPQLGNLETQQQLLSQIQFSELSLEALRFKLTEPLGPQMRAQTKAFSALLDEKVSSDQTSDLLARAEDYIQAEIENAFQKLAGPSDPTKVAAIDIRQVKPEAFFAQLNIQNVSFPKDAIECAWGSDGLNVDWSNGQLEIMEEMWPKAYTWSPGPTWRGDQEKRPTLREQAPLRQLVCRAQTPPVITLDLTDIKVAKGSVSRAVVTLTRRPNARPLLMRLGIVQDERSGAHFVIPDRENFLTILQDYDLQVSFPAGTQIAGADGMGALAESVQDVARATATNVLPKRKARWWDAPSIALGGSALVGSALIQREEERKVAAEIEAFWKTKKPEVAGLLFRQFLKQVNGNARERQYQGALRTRDPKISRYEFFPLYEPDASFEDPDKVGVMGKIENQIDKAGSTIASLLSNATNQLPNHQATLDQQIQNQTARVDPLIDRANEKIRGIYREGESLLVNRAITLPEALAPRAERELHRAVENRVTLPIESKINQTVLEEVRDRATVSLATPDRAMFPFRICKISNDNDVQSFLASFDLKSTRNNRSSLSEYPVEELSALIRETGQPAVALSYEYANANLILNEEVFRKRAENLVKYENGESGKRRFGIDRKFKIDALKPRLTSIDGKIHLVVEASYSQPASLFQHLVPVVTQVGDLPFLIGKSDIRPFRDGGGAVGTIPDFLLQPVMAPFLSVNQKRAQYLIPLESEFLPPAPGETKQRLVFRPNQEFERRVKSTGTKTLGTHIFQAVSETLLKERSLEIPFDPKIPGLEDRVTFETVGFRSLQGRPEWLALQFKYHHQSPANPVLDLRVHP